MHINITLPELSLRQCTPADSQFFYELKKLVLFHYVKAIWGWDEQVQQQFHAENFHPNQTQIILWQAQPVGTIELVEDKDKIFISSLYIHPDFQNKKIGTFLVQQQIQQAKTSGKKVALEVLRLNTRAQKLYSNLGFVTIPNNDAIKLYMQNNCTL
ncbi:GNAT family N-acetyltransferase [Hydrotalea sp.]|uniref:GNAT family N-acetyltransferase n=1 Tax=Hydrotalea sp. TaxID=2881279 RepID=UPI003D14FDCC